MSRAQFLNGDRRETRDEGNYLRKYPHQFRISYVANQLISELTYHWGLTRSDVIERAVRAMYGQDIGTWPAISREGYLKQREAGPM